MPRVTGWLSLAVVAAGCSFDVSALEGRLDPSTDAGVADVADAADSGSGSGCDAGAVCRGEVLQRCSGGKIIEESCPLGCKPDEARCYRFLAANVGDGRLDQGAADLLIQTNATLEVDQGTLDGKPLPVPWALEPQLSPYPKLAVLRVRDFVIAPGARLTLRGTAAVVILAARDITIGGVLDASATGKNGGPGGFAGGGRDGAGQGPGAGQRGNTATPFFEHGGGSGGGGGGTGGAGGTAGPLAVPPGGAGTSDLLLSPLYGGSGGGGGAGIGFEGGGGGGAVQLSAGARIVIGGALVAAGAGGGQGDVGTGATGAGSGGGGGGAVLLEAPAITIIGTVAAGGGGGGGAACSALLKELAGAAGAPGGEDGQVAGGGAAGCSGDGPGGNGGALDVPAQGGTEGSYNGGGGGGGFGRLRLVTRYGQPDVTGVLSPSYASNSVAYATFSVR